MQVSLSAVLRQYENPAAYGGMYCLISRAGSEEPISEPGLSTDTIYMLQCCCVSSRSKGTLAMTSILNGAGILDDLIDAVECKYGAE